MVQEHCQEETTNSENPLEGGNRPQGVKISEENFKVNRESLNRQTQQMTPKPVPTSGRSMVISTIVITLNLEFNSTCRRKKQFPIPLKYIDVSRTTHTDLDVMQEKRVDDNWNVDLNRSLSDSWKGLPYWKKNFPQDFCRPGRRQTKFKRLPDQKFGPNLVKPLRIERN